MKIKDMQERARDTKVRELAEALCRQIAGIADVDNKIDTLNYVR